MSSRAVIVSVLLATVCSACGGVVEERVVVRDPVAYDAPPPDRVEVVTVSPGPGHVWERGHWQRRGRGWFWIGGRWHRA